MTQKPDGIARLLNCPTKGDEIRRAIAQSRKDFLDSVEGKATIDCLEMGRQR
ncbi:hypothetical protein D3C85_1774220 [compost metagenome]